MIKLIKTALNLTILFNLILYTQAYASRGEGNIGNGTDLVPITENSAWFLGRNKSIRVCFQKHQKFDVSPADIETSIRTAFSIWDDYLDQKEIRSVNNKSDKFDLVTKIQILPECDNSEDLKFYFGSEDKVTRKIKTQYVHPIAFVAKTHEDIENGWSKGFVWINLGKDFWGPKADIDWTDHRNLVGLLLHEIGHLLGCSHSVDTIMDDVRLLKILQQPSSSKAKQALSQIDGKLELYLCEKCEFNYRGEISTRQLLTAIENAGNIALLFQLFLGRPPVLGSSSPIYYQVKTDKLNRSMQLDITDAEGSVVIPITPLFDMYGGVNKTYRDGIIFNSIRNNPKETYLRRVESIITYGSAKTLKEGQITVAVERNAALFGMNERIHLIFFYKNKMIRLHFPIIEN